MFLTVNYESCDYLIQVEPDGSWSVSSFKGTHYKDQCGDRKEDEEELAERFERRVDNAISRAKGIDPLPSAKELAREFSNILRGWLTPEEMEQVVIANRDETNPHVCHSADYCDANMAMIQAFENVSQGGFIQDGDDQFQAWRWNEAWELAKKAEFKSEEIK